MFPVYKMPAPLAERFREAGYAIAATKGDALLDVVLVRELVPEFDGDGPGDGNWGRAMEALKDARCAQRLLQLESAGDALHAGVACAHEFMGLKRFQSKS